MSGPDAEPWPEEDRADYADRADRARASRSRRDRPERRDRAGARPIRVARMRRFVRLRPEPFLISKGGISNTNGKPPKFLEPGTLRETGVRAEARIRLGQTCYDCSASQNEVLWHSLSAREGPAHISTPDNRLLGVLPRELAVGMPFSLPGSGMGSRCSRLPTDDRLPSPHKCSIP